MNWAEFKDTAVRLARGTTEGDWRSAASRSYYAAFHYFRDLFLSHGLDIGRGGQAHFNLHAGLANCGFGQVASIGRRVDRLRDRRVSADYDLSHRSLQREGQWASQECDNMVTDFQLVLGTQSVGDIVDGVKQYLQGIGHIPKTP